MSSVLFISPSEKWLNIAVQSLDKFFKADFALTGKAAQLKLYKSQFSFVFVGLDTSNNSGLEVIRYIQSSKSQAKVFAIVEEKSLEELGISEAAIKKLGVVEVFYQLPANEVNNPIKSLGAIKRWHDVTPLEGKVEQESESTITDDQFARIRIDELFEDTIAIFDYYLRLNAHKYIKIIHKGETATSEQLKRYSDNGTQYLYFLTKDRIDFVGYQNELTHKMLKNKKIDEMKVLKSIKTSTDKYIDEVFIQGIQPQLIDEGRNICKNMFDLAQRDKDLKKILSTMEEVSPTAYSHSFLVCFFCTLISKHLDWVGPKSREALLIGALFHDIGLIHLPKEIMDKDIDNLSEEEFTIFKQHPHKGIKALEGIPSINSSIQFVVAQHHEMSNGGGFPEGLSASKIYPLAKIVALADAFTEYITKNEVNPLDGLKGFLASKDTLARYESDLIKNLIKSFVGEKKA